MVVVVPYECVCGASAGTEAGILRHVARANSIRIDSSEAEEPQIAAAATEDMDTDGGVDGATVGMTHSRGVGGIVGGIGFLGAQRQTSKRHDGRNSTLSFSSPDIVPSQVDMDSTERAVGGGAVGRVYPAVVGQWSSSPHPANVLSPARGRGDMQDDPSDVAATAPRKRRK